MASRREKQRVKKQVQFAFPPLPQDQKERDEELRRRSSFKARNFDKAAAQKQK